MGVNLSLNAIKHSGHYRASEEKELSVPTKSQREHLLSLK